MLKIKNNIVLPLGIETDPPITLLWDEVYAYPTVAEYGVPVPMDYSPNQGTVTLNRTGQYHFNLNFSYNLPSLEGGNNDLIIMYLVVGVPGLPPTELLIWLDSEPLNGADQIRTMSGSTIYNNLVVGTKVYCAYFAIDNVPNTAGNTIVGSSFFGAGPSTNLIIDYIHQDTQTPIDVSVGGGG
jgi:hypothetical protein